MLAPALWRESIAKDMDEVAWHVLGVDSIFDVRKMKAYWLDRGLVLHQVRAAAPPLSSAGSSARVDGRRCTLLPLRRACPRAPRPTLTTRALPWTLTTRTACA